MSFKFDGNTFAEAVRAVLRRYASSSNARVIVAQRVEDIDTPETIADILDDNGFQEYRLRCLDDIAYVVFTVRGIVWPRPLQLHIPQDQLDRAARMIQSEQ